MTGPDVGATVAFADYARDVEALRKQLADAQATVEALRRELLEWKRALCGLTPGGSEFADDHAYCAEWVRKARENQHDIIISKHRELKATQAALDAEREKVENWEHKIQSRGGLALIDDARAKAGLYDQLATQLTQLQALVRALPCLDGEIKVKTYHHESERGQEWDEYECGDAGFDNLEAANVYEALLRYRATLGATTPAQTDEQRFIEACCERPHDCKWGGTGGCGYEGRKPKGGDGE